MVIQIKNSESDAKPDITLKIDVFAGEVGRYQSDMTLHVMREVAGLDDRERVEVGCFVDQYEGVTLQYIHKTLLTRAADYLIEKDITGLVAIEGNQAGNITQFAGTGITRYKANGSELYLSPYPSYQTEQAAKAEYISYRVEDIPEIDRRRRDHNKKENEGVQGIVGRTYSLQQHKE